jgi:death-on-curing family protein
LRRPQHAAFYEGADILTQAALYMMGIAMNHPFVDGNKRAGFAVGVTFLRLNGYTGAADQLNDVAPGQWLEQVVAHILPPAEFTERLRARLAE